ncbi:MAG: hypothetical protein WBA28_08770 [Microbacteriaceae bacterium]
MLIEEAIRELQLMGRDFERFHQSTAEGFAYEFFRTVYESNTLSLVVLDYPGGRQTLLLELVTGQWNGYIVIHPQAEPKQVAAAAEALLIADEHVWYRPFQEAYFQSPLGPSWLLDAPHNNISTEQMFLIFSYVRDLLWMMDPISVADERVYIPDEYDTLEMQIVPRVIIGSANEELWNSLAVQLARDWLGQKKPSTETLFQLSSDFEELVRDAAHYAEKILAR